MKIKFNGVVVHSQNEPYTQQQFEEFKALLQETEPRKVLNENDLVEIVANLFGEHINRKWALDNDGQFKPEVKSRLERYRSLIDSISIEVNGFSVSTDSVEDYEYRQYDYFQYGRSYVELDFELTISNLTLRDIDSINQHSGCISINNGLGYFLEVQLPAA